MKLVEIYLIMSVIALVFVGIAWSRGDLLNILVKSYFIISAAIGAYLILNRYFPQAGISL